MGARHGASTTNAARTAKSTRAERQPTPFCTSSPGRADMPLNALGRKVLLPFGAQRRIARKLGVSTSYVSQIVNGGKIPRSGDGRKVAVAVSRALGMKLHEAFAELAPETVQHRAQYHVTSSHLTQ